MSKRKHSPNNHSSFRKTLHTEVHSSTALLILAILFFLSLGVLAQASGYDLLALR